MASTLRPLTLVAVAAALWGCSGPASSTTVGEESTTSETSAFEVGSGPLFEVSIPEAITVNVASNGEHFPVVAWTSPGMVSVAELDLDRAQIGPGTDVSGEIDPFPHPIERPAIAIRRSGEVDIAFTTLVGGGGSVYRTSWDREAAEPPTLVSGAPRPETVLVHAAHTPDGALVLSWLEDSTLSIAIPDADGMLIELEMVDDLTCDCCNPVPVVSGDELVVAYRDLERSGTATFRDVVIVRTEDGGVNFEMVPVADDRWDLNACPFSGPAVVSSGGELVVAWMDARQSVHPDQSSSTIWVDRSTDGGRNFGDDLAVSRTGINRWPVLAVDETGTLHIVWEMQGPDGGILYAYSTDGGRSFSPPSVLVSHQPGSGAPGVPSVVVHHRRLIVSWTDATGGHVAVWDLDTPR